MRGEGSTRSTTAKAAPVFKFDRCHPAEYRDVPKRGGLSPFPRPRNVLHAVASRSVLPSSVAISVAAVRVTFCDRRARLCRPRMPGAPG
jgi:hypothetical protein